MKVSKSILAVAAAAIVMVAGCLYLIDIERTYGGAVDVALTGFTVTVPLIAAIQLWQIHRGGFTDRKPQVRWQKLVLWCLLAGFLILAVCLLLRSHFYSLPAIILLVIFLAAGVQAAVFRKRAQKPAHDPLMVWTVDLITIYVLICGVVFSYLQIVKPVTVEQAAVLVAETSHEEPCRFIGWLTGDRDETPLGVYWFMPENSTLGNGIYISVTTGEILKNG